MTETSEFWRLLVSYWLFFFSLLKLWMIKAALDVKRQNTETHPLNYWSTFVVTHCEYHFFSISKVFEFPGRFAPIIFRPLNRNNSNSNNIGIYPESHVKWKLWIGRKLTFIVVIICSFLVREFSNIRWFWLNCKKYPGTTSFRPPICICSLRDGNHTWLLCLCGGRKGKEVNLGITEISW